MVTIFGVVTCGGTNGHYQSKCTILTQDGKAKSFPSMVSHRHYFQMVVINDSLYAIGGASSSDTMEVINIKYGREWDQEELPFSVFAHCAVVINNKIIL